MKQRIPAQDFCLLGSALLACAFFIHCPATIRAQSSDQLLEQLKSKAVPSWRAVEAADDRPSSVKITTQLKTFSKGRLEKDEITSAIMRRKPGWYVYETLKGRSESKSVRGSNPQYSFGLLKLGESDEWALDSLKIKGKLGYSAIDEQLEPYIKPNGSSFLLTMGPLSKVVNAPQFKAIRAESKEGGLVRVHYQTAFLKDIPITGWFDFDPGNSWALTRSEFSMGTGMTLSLNKTFSEEPRDGYRPCTAWETFVKNNDNSEAKSRVSYEIIEDSAPSAELFTLTHYGISEPQGVPPVAGGSNWWLWFGTLAFVALGIGAFLFRRARQRRANTAQAPVR